ncbi:helix-turn-helix domain-containing protein [Leifsonia sp. P73]|uniref:helix-turn-helix domain-containing protein n=1 Tax=Leifsonia sp. P73 TaxID=3423959 RepID=UPI003DA1E48A
MKAELTVAEAVAASGRSKTTVYRWIADGLLKATDTSEGLIVRSVDLMRVAGRHRRGRPRGTPKYR